MNRIIVLVILSLTLVVWENYAISNETNDSSYSKSNEVNIYSSRKGYLLKPLLEQFEYDTRIKVNIISGKSKVLQKRIEQEGENTQADVLLTVDAGNLYQAKKRDLLKNISSKKLDILIPAHLRDDDGYWYGLSIRSRVIMYNPEVIKKNELTTYEDLSDPKWRKRICMRSSGNIYNQSLLASLISHLGETEAKVWAEGLVSNFSRDPKGNDRTQMTSVVLGECDITLANTYYLGKWMTSKKEIERKYATKIAVFFPNQESTGAHINITGAAVVKHSKNIENAIKLIEYLAGDKAQELYAKTNHEYPVRENVKVSSIVYSWGYPFVQDQLHLNNLGINNEKAAKIFDEVNWQ